MGNWGGRWYTEFVLAFVVILVYYFKVKLSIVVNSLQQQIKVNFFAHSLIFLKLLNNLNLLNTEKG